MSRSHQARYFSVNRPVQPNRNKLKLFIQLACFQSNGRTEEDNAHIPYLEKKRKDKKNENRDVLTLRLQLLLLKYRRSEYNTSVSKQQVDEYTSTRPPQPPRLTTTTTTMATENPNVSPVSGRHQNIQTTTIPVQLNIMVIFLHGSFKSLVIKTQWNQPSL